MAIPSDERVWVRRARDGDPQAYRSLVEHHQASIARLVSGILGSGHGNIDDVVQEVFVKAYFSLGKFREESSFGTWLYRIAVNRARDELKKDARMASMGDWITEKSLEALQGLFPREEPEDDEETEETSDPPEALRRLVGGAIAGLPEKLRVVTTLKDIEGLSYQEVGEILRCSIGTVKSRHARARARLRNALSPYVAELRTRSGEE